MNRVNKHVKGDQYLTDLKYEALSRYEEHPNESRRKAKDFSDYRSRSSSSSNGYRPVACAIFEDCVVEEELRVLLRLLAVRCVPGGSPQFGHRPFEALPGKTLSVWTTPSVVSAGTCFCHRLSWLLNDDAMGQILSGLTGLNVRKRVQRFCEAIRDFPEGGVAPHGLVTIERKDSRVGIRELTEDQAEAWMLNGCPPILAAAAYFESSREKPEHVEEFLVAWQLIGEQASEDDLKKGTSSYLTQCRTILGLFIQYMTTMRTELIAFVPGTYTQVWATSLIWSRPTISQFRFIQSRRCERSLRTSTENCQSEEHQDTFEQIQPSIPTWLEQGLRHFATSLKKRLRDYRRNMILSLREWCAEGQSWRPDLWLMLSDSTTRSKRMRTRRSRSTQSWLTLLTLRLVPQIDQEQLWRTNPWSWDAQPRTTWHWCFPWCIICTLSGTTGWMKGNGQGTSHGSWRLTRSYNLSWTWRLSCPQCWWTRSLRTSSIEEVITSLKRKMETSSRWKEGSRPRAGWEIMRPACHQLKLGGPFLHRIALY